MRRTINFFSKLLIACAFVLGINGVALSQQVLLQGFWWDFQNNNYPNGWANYLTDLAPRLKSMGINAIWIPPSIKNGNQGNGYSPFDNYDLGDKYQKNILKTRLGNKDELLRMIAVMHANGIDVVQDIVLNHVDNAGSATGAGGQDPAAMDDFTTSRYKNFRYTSFISPATDETATNYLSRRGRFSKNWQNFYPNPANTSTTGDWNSVYWGPDIAYDAGSYGQSSNATFNPAQGTNYMRDNTRNWLIWYKKQLGFDGVRIDAVKHFPHWAMEDFLYNMQANAGWASGSSSMFAVGEFVGGSADMDGWMTNVQDRAGTFDFSLRNDINSMVTGNGGFDIGSIPGYQQGKRVIFTNNRWVHRTVPFVNNHDTFRPILSTTGTYTGWNTGSELAPHIDPFNVRLSPAYAIAMAVDGSPQIFFEDLFDVGGTGKRFTHLPTSATDLPVRSDIANLIWCHQNLRFKDGAYKVRWQAADHLIIERSARAIISVNDSWDAWQNSNILTDFAPGTVLKDYSGANGTATVTVDANQRVNINTPPCNGTANNGRRGYAVWAPTTATTNFATVGRSTTQEWELDNDLGDSHASSLKQGGQLPANNSTTARTVGNIFTDANRTISYEVYRSNSAVSVTIEFFRGTTLLHSKQITGTTTTGSYIPATAGWVTIKVRNTSSTNTPAQKLWVKATYTPPATVNTASNPAPAAAASMGGLKDDAAEPMAVIEEGSLLENKFNLYPNPTVAENININVISDTERTVTLKIVDIKGSEVHTEKITLYKGANDMRITPQAKLETGLYILTIPEMAVKQKLNIR